MKINNIIKGFTLVEMLIGVALSTVLMVSISIFVTNGIKNVTVQKKVLDNISQDLDFFMELESVFKRVNGTGTIIGSGVLLPINTKYDNGAYSYIGIKTFSGKICNNNDGGDLEGDEFLTNHIYLKRLFPYEGPRKSTNNFSTFAGSNFVKDDSGNIIIGKEIFGDKGEDGDLGIDFYLNNPTGIVGTANMLFISDTFNNRVLLYDVITKKVNIILDSSDGLLLPSGLAFNYSDKILYIANTGKGEILKYSWGSNVDKKLDIGFKLNKNIVNFKKLEIEFAPSITSINEPNSKDDFSFVGINKNTSGDVFDKSGNLATYFFENFSNKIDDTGEISIINCDNNDDNIYYDNTENRYKFDDTKCTDTNTGNILTYVSSYSDLLIGNKRIKVTPDLDLDDTTGTGSYYVYLKLIGDNTFEEYFPLFTIGDDDIETKDDNSLSVIKSGFSYPTGLEYPDSDTLKIYDFVDRKKYTLNLNTLNMVDPGLPTYDFDTIDYENDYLLDVPIKDFKFTNVDGLQTLVIHYYKKYDCSNPDERVLRTMIFKKNIKN